MGVRDFRIKLKAFRLKRFFLGNRGRKRTLGIAKKPSWMVPITHGHHVVEHRGISQMRRKTKETLKRAYLGAKTKIREANKSEETCRIGSTSVMVINGEKLVIANMGDYRTVLCRDGIAYQTTGRNNQSAKGHWYRRLFSGNSTGTKHSKGSELVVGGEWVDPDTEFLILASNGIWEVMKNQEAVNLIWHIEDPQEAAECLAKEALIRMSKSNISCLIIRFD